MKKRKIVRGYLINYTCQQKWFLSGVYDRTTDFIYVVHDKPKHGLHSIYHIKIFQNRLRKYFFKVKKILILIKGRTNFQEIKIETLREMFMESLLLGRKTSIS